MRTRITRVLVAMTASAAMMAGLAASSTAATAASPARAAAAAAQAAAARHHAIAYVTVMTWGAGQDAVVPVDTVTGATLKPIPVDRNPGAIAVTPNGKYAYVVNETPPSVAVIRTRTGTVVKTIPIPGPQGMGVYIGITPNGKTVYVSFGATVVPIRTADNKVLKPIPTGVAVTGLVFTPDSRKLYVDSWNSKVVPIRTRTNTAGSPIRVPPYDEYMPGGLTISPDGRTLYAAYGTMLTPISTVTDKPGKPILFAEQIINIAISPNGRTGYVANAGTYAGPGKVFPVNLRTHKILAPINLPGVAGWMRFTPDGKTLYALQQQAAMPNYPGVLTAIRTATKTVLRNITVGNMPMGFAITPDGRNVYVIAWGENSLIPVRTATNKAGPAIKLNGWPTAVAFFRR
jgi:DNA-binding beta-propeller fold protein YncE